MAACSSREPVRHRNAVGRPREFAVEPASVYDFRLTPCGLTRFIPRHHSGTIAASTIMHEKPIVIAGGSGFLGISLATYLTALGRKVVILSRGVPKVAGPWQHVEWDARTLGQLGMLKELFKSHFVCDVFLQRSFIKTRQPVDHLMQFLFGPAFLFNLCKIMRDTEENVIFAIRSSCSFARFILRYPFYSLCIRQELLAEDLR